MWFGQTLHIRGDEVVHGRWIPYDTRTEAVIAGHHLVSVLELVCTRRVFRSWEKSRRKQGKDPRGYAFRVPFRGPFYADFDSDDPEQLQEELVQKLHQLFQATDLDEDLIRLWYSGGKGFHLEIPTAVFGDLWFQHPNLPAIYRRFGQILGLGDCYDSSVYSAGRGRLWRVSFKRRPNGNRKIPLSFSMLRDWSFSSIRRLSRSGEVYRIEEPKALVGNPLMKEWFRQAKREVLFPDPPKSFQPSKPRLLQPIDPHTYKEVSQALVEAVNRLPIDLADHYDPWLRVGMAIHQTTGGSDSGFHLWREWSQQSAKFDLSVLVRKWVSFHVREKFGVGLGTLFHLANNHA